MDLLKSWWRNPPAAAQSATAVAGTPAATATDTVTDLTSNKPALVKVPRVENSKRKRAEVTDDDAHDLSGDGGGGSGAAASGAVTGNVTGDGGSGAAASGAASGAVTGNVTGDGGSGAAASGAVTGANQPQPFQASINDEQVVLQQAPKVAVKKKGRYRPKGKV